MAEPNEAREEIFPKDPGKSYSLVELVKGDSPMVGKGPDDTVFSFPIVLLWEILLLLGVSLAIFLFSLVKQAPLGDIANPQLTTDPAKAPWYFVGLQELLEHMHPTLAGIILPGALVSFLVAIPYLDNSKAGAGIWFSSRRGARIAAGAAIYALIAVPAYIALDNAFPAREIFRYSLPQWAAQGLIPAAILLVLTGLPLLVLWRLKANTNELIIALFTLILVSGVVFTISGFLFRGPGFVLYWPWEMPNGYNPWADL
ncbi:MAG: hypothetical protein BMS9Abin28_1652 [Anaerolineae bacterium]|nr:MAG: hypothetical protein BMS9Abin28_1652 [Anaerolineae bacterium]